MKRTPYCLIILDGLANNPNTESNAVYHAKTPTLDRLRADFPQTELITFGNEVGLPEGQMGNSEVGHLNIGAGQIVYQDIMQINNMITDGSLQLNKTIEEISKTKGTVHLIGLCSNGGVHSSNNHCVELIKVLANKGTNDICLHIITDGRDRPTDASIKEVSELLDQISNYNVKIGSVGGRYWSMDRDKRFERTKKSTTPYCQNSGSEYKPNNIPKAKIIDYLKEQHKEGITDEFIEPVAIEQTFIKQDDSVLFFNFRSDRMKQIVSLLSEMCPQASMYSMTDYECGTEVIYQRQEISSSFGESISNAGLKQLRVAETEKYPHVTYFFNGGKDIAFAGENRQMVPSPKDVPTYDLKPQMSAEGVTQIVTSNLQKNEQDVYVINFANCDMVGHTGNFDATVKAVETVDFMLGVILGELDKVGGSALITADHGNADQMIIYETGAPHTFHTKHPVPLFLYGEDIKGTKLKRGGALCNIAPTILELLHIDRQKLMSCSLIS